MRRRSVRGVVAPAIFAAMLAVAPAASAADCWLLGEAELATAQAQGRCHDVFARAAPEAKAAPVRKEKAKRRASSKKPARQADLLTRIEQLAGSVKPAAGSSGHRRGGGIDHLSYGRTSPGVDR